jgi:hypothetical protein
MEVNLKSIGPYIKLKDFKDELTCKKGVYLWVYNYKPKRIIYIGSATGQEGFYKRLNNELNQINCGHYFIVKSNGGDPYNYLINDNIPDKSKLLLTYKERRKNLWIPGNNGKNIFGDDFNSSWKNFLREDYLNNLISIYILTIANTNEEVNIIKQLETQLQRFLVIKKRIGYYDPKVPYQSWLGQPSIPIDSNYKFCFNQDSFLEFHDDNLDFDNFDMKKILSDQNSY